MNKIKTKDLVLADIRIYEKGKGVIVDDDMPKVFLIKKNERYFNVFNKKEEYPLFKRFPYANVSLDGEAYGTKIYVGDEEELDEVGICAIESNDDLINKIREQDEVDIEDLKRIIIEATNMYFKDRKRIIQDNYTLELDNLRKKYPTKDDDNYFRRIYRFKTRVMMKTGLNKLLRDFKIVKIDEKYFSLFEKIAIDTDKNTHYNHEVYKVKQKVR